MAVNWANDHASAILEAWYAGEEGGTAIAETLAGGNNPAGRLPVTFYKGVEQLPPFDDYAMKSRTYRYFSGQPLYPFGYGLSYSAFTYSGLKLNQDLQAGDPLAVEVDVKNTSQRAGDETVELYLGFPESWRAHLCVRCGRLPAFTWTLASEARHAEPAATRVELCQRGRRPAHFRRRLRRHGGRRTAGNQQPHR